MEVAWPMTAAPVLFKGEKIPATNIWYFTDQDSARGEEVVGMTGGIERILHVFEQRIHDD